MLVMGRKRGQRVIVNDTIEVVVIEINRGEVKLGFNFPPDTTIYKQEDFKKAGEEETQEDRAIEAQEQQLAEEAEFPLLRIEDCKADMQKTVEKEAEGPIPETEMKAESFSENVDGDYIPNDEDFTENFDYNDGGIPGDDESD